MTYVEEMEMLNGQIKTISRVGLDFCVERFRRNAVSTRDMDSNSLNDFLGWIDMKKDNYEQKNA